MFNSPLSLFDANIFWNHPLSLAYTDGLFLLVPQFALVRALGGSWALSINSLMLTLLFGSLWATFMLVRRLTARTDAAVLAAIAFTFSSFTLAHLGHTQLLLLGQFPLGFWFVFRWIEKRRMIDAVFVGLLNLSFFLGALYYAATWMVCIAVVLAGYLIATRLHPGPKFWTGILVMGVCTSIALPALIPYARLNQERPLVPEYAFKPADLVTVSPGSILYGDLDAWASKRSARLEHSLFPGFITFALALTGAGAIATRSFRKRRYGDDVSGDGIAPCRRQEVALVLLAGAACAILALGPEVRGIPLPFKAFHAFVPGFNGIRVAGRIAIVALLSGCVLMAIGYSWLMSHVRNGFVAALTVAVGALLLLELVAPLYRSVLPTDSATLAVYRALANKPRGAVVELPLINPAREGGAAWAYVEAPRMVYSTEDWQNRFNGYSGGWPEGYLEELDLLNTFPDDASLATARRFRIRYVVLHVGPASGFPQWSNERIEQTLRTLPEGASASQFGKDWLVDLEGMK